jgi:hypothetical protein
MISHPVAGAVQALQQQALTSRDTFQLDRIDRALDELLRNPTEQTGPAPSRVRSAMGHAYEALERRRALAPRVPLDPEHTDSSYIDARYPVVEILAWLTSEPNLNAGERVVLGELARGHDAASIAHRDGVALTQTRQRISRARRHARVLWQTAEGTA